VLRRHLYHIARKQTRSEATGYESQLLTVGFVDLVGSTPMASRLSTSELGAALTSFEATASDIVVKNGGRVVKLIGDEIMFTTTDPANACAIAAELVHVFEGHPVLPGVRAGLAHGQVLTRDGDCFGPVVNLAARVVGMAEPGTVVISADVPSHGWAVEPLGPKTLKGFDAPVELARLHLEI
jgi:adenylate cyclase